MDIPTDRSSHVVATPRGGGLACLLGLLGAVALAPGLGASPKLLLVSSGGALAILGFVDDVHHLKVRLRFGIQIVIAVVGSYWAFGLSWPASAGTLLLAAVGVIWIVAYVNAFNFMDGVNGLAGEASVVAGLTFVLVGLDRDDPTLAIGGAARAGAALAFMPWIVPPSKVLPRRRGQLSVWRDNCCPVVPGRSVDGGGGGTVVSAGIADVIREAAVAFVVTGIAAPIVLRSLRRGHVMDPPSDRSSHVVATPRGGGLASARAGRRRRPGSRPRARAEAAAH